MCTFNRLYIHIFTLVYSKDHKTPGIEQEVRREAELSGMLFYFLYSDN